MENVYLESLKTALDTWGIEDTRVRQAMYSTPRDFFVSKTVAHMSYEDSALPIGCGQTISQPSIVALMTQALEVKSSMSVLEIGTGSGYQTAVLSHLARRVLTIERHRSLLMLAEKRFHELKIYNIITHHGDGGFGWKARAPFERIMVTASADDIPPILVKQLAPGGVMVLPVGLEGDVQDLLRVRRIGNGIEVKKLKEVRFVPLLEGIGEDENS